MNKNLERFLEWLKNDSTFLLIDLEANTQWDWDSEWKDLETIQIGYVTFDSRFNILKKWSIFVKPTKNPTLSAFIMDLTWVNQAQVDNGVLFSEWLEQMMILFKEYGCYYILSYWNYDMKQLYSDCRINNIVYPFFQWNEWHSEKHINIKNALASKLNMREKWMGKLMEYLWLELEWKHHDWEDDCFNIFKIIKDQFFSDYDNDDDISKELELLVSGPKMDEVEAITDNLLASKIIKNPNIF